MPYKPVVSSLGVELSVFSIRSDFSGFVPLRLLQPLQLSVLEEDGDEVVEHGLQVEVLSQQDVEEDEEAGEEEGGEEDNEELREAKTQDDGG